MSLKCLHRTIGARTIIPCADQYFLKINSPADQIFREFWSPGPKFSLDQNFRDRPPRSDYRVKHGSSLYPAESKEVSVCRLQGNTNWTQRKNPGCPLYAPALCQTLLRDCHKMWHLPSFNEKQTQWFAGQTKASSQSSFLKPLKHGQPKRSVNRRQQRGAYHSK